jgi:predicted secreted protein
MANEQKEYSVLDGTDLILSVDGVALAFSTGCKITTSVETGERVTKEAASGKWGEKYVKKFSEEISADGCNLVNGDDDMPTYDQLKEFMLAGKPIDAQYSLRDGSKRTGKTEGGYKGKYLITSLDLDAQAGDDSKYSVKLENVGAVTKAGDGLTETATA